MKLSIVIVSWNTCALLKDCLVSVFTYPPHCEFDVWVVDNASNDGSVAMIREQFPQVRLIENQENVGFARANNQALKMSEGRYVMLLNPDTEVKPKALEALVMFLDEHPDVGAAGSWLLNADGSLQVSCHPTPTLIRELWRLFHLDTLYAYSCYEMHKWDTRVSREVDVLKGASIAVRREVLDKTGLLDENFFMYSEEVDLCYRLQKAGWRVYWVPQSQVVHYSGQSTQQVAFDMFLQLYKGKLLYFRKHYGTMTASLYKLILLAGSLARLMLIPLAWFQKSPQRNKNLRLGRYYARLITALPVM